MVTRAADDFASIRDDAPQIPSVNLADKIVMRPIGALIPYASNARTHSDAQIAQIAASIREFGFTNPVLIDGKQGIIAGHGSSPGCSQARNGPNPDD